MWYLIVPPIIVIASLSFVLWYFSRKSADPLIAEKALRLEHKAEQQIFFARTKSLLLHFLEKTASRFKVMSLQAHNALHDFTQTIKARQRRFQEKLPQVSGREQSAPSVRFLRRWMKNAETDGGISSSEIHPMSERESPADAVAQTADEMIVIETARISQTVITAGAQETATEESEIFIRPMVSDTIAHPERTKESAPADIRREEALIGRIAVNPKDVVAYEGLGDYYLDIGNVKDAKECYRQVLRLSPAHRMVRIKIRRLEKILSEKS